MIEEPTRTWVESTKKAVKTLQQRFKKNKGMLLTEGDLECHLFNDLMKQSELSDYHPSKSTNIYDFSSQTDNKLKTSYIHSQVTWFRPYKESGFEVDLTISDPKYLEVKNLKLLERYPHKGFAYDGPCVAVELKFIRQVDDANNKAHQDLLKLLDNLIPSKLKNIQADKYKISNENNIAFVSLVGCKDKETFIQAKFYLGKHLSLNKKRIGDNIFVGLFYQDEIVWDQNELINYYKKQLSKKPKKF